MTQWIMMNTQDPADIIDACHDKESREGFASLTEHERVIVLVSHVDFEVATGGIIGYFTNSAGDRCQDAIQALREVGASDAAESLSNALAEFPDLEATRSREYRQEFIPKIGMRLEDYSEGVYEQMPSVRELLEDYASRWYGRA